MPKVEKKDKGQKIYEAFVKGDRVQDICDKYDIDLDGVLQVVNAHNSKRKK